MKRSSEKFLSNFNVLFKDKNSNHWSKIFKKDFAYVVDVIIKAMINKETEVDFPVVYIDSMERLESMLEMLNLQYETKVKKRKKEIICPHWESEMFEIIEETVTHYIVSL